MIMLVCTYYGYAAHMAAGWRGGRPGRACLDGRRVDRNLVMTLAIYGQSPNFHLAT